MLSRRLLIVIATVLVIGLATVGLMPVYQSHARLGLDLQGGVMVRLEAPEGTSAEDMNGAMTIINRRVDAIGVANPDVRREGENRILVELPGVADPEQAIRMIGTTAKMEFIRGDNQQVVLDGSQLKAADAYTDDQAVDPSKRYGVSLEFNDQGGKAFDAATEDLVRLYPSNKDPRRTIAIVLDGEVISNPFIENASTKGKASISGGYQSYDEAKQLSTLLNSGALPVELKIIEQSTVGAQLGPDAIAKSLQAAIIGLVLLTLFILAAYRGPGLVAILSLVLYAVLLAGSQILIKSTITLEVIAAFLLSIGMAVDANVLIYERIREELRAGKSTRVSTESGFKKAFATILDSNVTTLIASIVLIILGTGFVRGFAVTLTFGILLSLFTAISFTRFVLRNLVIGGAVKSPQFYGVKGEK